MAMIGRMQLLASFMLLPSCGQAVQEPSNEANLAVPAETLPANTSPVPTPPEPGVPGGLPEDRTPLEEPQGAIDPKSAEAAGQVVQSYGALIEQGRWDEAERLWGDPARGRGVSDDLKRNREVHLQVGKPEVPEGAAGSIYVSVPVVLYGKRSDGREFSQSGEATLRRVNDVPGSTAAQRRWHIDSMAFLERA